MEKKSYKNTILCKYLILLDIQIHEVIVKVHFGDIQIYIHKKSEIGKGGGAKKKREEKREKIKEQDLLVTNFLETVSYNYHLHNCHFTWFSNNTFSARFSRSTLKQKAKIKHNRRTKTKRVNN